MTPAQVYFRTKKIPVKREFESVLRDYSITKKILRIRTKVRIICAKNTVFEKSNLQPWTRETFVVYRVFLTDPVTYSLRDLEGEIIQGRCYRNKLKVL